MKFRFPLLLPSLLLLLSTTACEDPSNVGLGLVGEQGGVPTVITVGAERFTQVPLEDVTGGSNLNRVLAGTVADPLLGTIAARSYVDFGAPILSGGFRTGTVASASLRLRPDYLYGDTTATVRLRLLSLPSEFTAANASPDTTLATGDPIVEFEFQASDSLVVVPLPESWVEANDATLRSTTFSEAFYGFALEPVSGDVVVGFATAGSRLFATTGSDSAQFNLVKAITGLERLTEPTLPDGRLALQNGVGPTAALAFDLTADDLQDVSVNRTVLRVFADTLLLEAAGPFRRPTLGTLDLMGVTDEGETVPIERASLGDDGAFSFRSNALRAELQRVVAGQRVYESFELRPPVTAVNASSQSSIVNTINPMIFYDAGLADRAPYAVFTVTPVE